MFWVPKRTVSLRRFFCHWDGPFEYPQHMFCLKNKKNNIQLHTFIWRPDNFACWIIFHAYVLMLNFFKIIFFKKFFEGLDSDQDQNSVEPDCVVSLCKTLYFLLSNEGAQWLSGRVLDLRPKGRRFELHRHHCVVVFEQDTFIIA